jgi:hypothetical protein
MHDPAALQLTDGWTDIFSCRILWYRAELMVHSIKASHWPLLYGSYCVMQCLVFGRHNGTRVVQKVILWLICPWNILPRVLMIIQVLFGKLQSLFRMNAMLKVTKLFSTGNSTANVCLWRLHGCVLDFIHLSATGVAEITESTNLKGWPHTFVHTHTRDVKFHRYASVPSSNVKYTKCNRSKCSMHRVRKIA